MKKYLSILAIAAICGMALTSCDDDDAPASVPANRPVPPGMFVVNAGSYYNGIDGTLTYIGKDGSIEQKAFYNTNGRSLGGTPNDIVIYGSKVYIVATDENTVEVIDKNMLTSVKQISTIELMGEDKGTQPRHLTASGQYVYVSTYAGYVAAIDTTSLTAANVYQVGDYPEGMIVSNGYLYSADSSYGNGENPSISAINLNTGEVQKITDQLITNPQSFAEIDGEIYFLDSGLYTDDYSNQYDAGIRKLEKGTVEAVADATLMAANPTAGLIYIINAPYTTPATVPTFYVYNTRTGDRMPFISGEDIVSPTAIAVDQGTGNVYIGSYSLDADTGYADYNSDGYVVEYTSDGKFVAKYPVGVDPVAFAFNNK